MKVPEGFSVEMVAAEPDIVNPVAMTFDERGRIWITESLEYPRHEPGPGATASRSWKTPTATAGSTSSPSLPRAEHSLGHCRRRGGVWVANCARHSVPARHRRRRRADRREVVVTGFGRDDTHELPNSLTWGPDGWLYGLNGVFNPHVVQQADRDCRLHVRDVPHRSADAAVRDLLPRGRATPGASPGTAEAARS